MNQSRLGSLYEVIVSICVGFSINWVMNLLILPLYGFHINGGQAFSMGLIFTVVSVIRGYCIRRWFEKRIRRFAHRLAGDLQ